jgi:carbon-monoxide dehydrogenase medium subunit
MIPAAFAYVAPGSVPEAVELLRRHGTEAKILAGGQSLIPMMRFRLATPSLLIDIGRIADLRYLREEGGWLRIGALTTHADVERSPLVRERYPLLAGTAAWVADPVVRNLGTVCGSLAHADPAGDWGPALLAARAEAVITGPSGERVLPLDDFFVDTFTTALREDEILTEVRVPAPSGRTGGSYRKIERKVGDFATAAVGVQVTLGGDGRIREVGIGLCAAGPVSLRARHAEASLLGQVPTDEAIARAGELAAAQSDPRDDARGPAEYKRDMFRVLTVRALRAAVDSVR